jgi:hypothetical protein
MTVRALAQDQGGTIPPGVAHPLQRLGADEIRLAPARPSPGPSRPHLPPETG